MSQFSEDMKSFLDNYIHSMKLRQDAATKAFATGAVPKLAELGIRRLDVTYSGYGDSGAIDDWTAYGDDDEEIPVPQDLSDDVVEFVLQLVPAGFENNEGGEGTVKIDVVKGTYVLTHGERRVEIDWSEREGTF